MSPYQNLRVTIVLQTPMIEPKDLLHLDAVLGSLKVSEAKAKLGEGINPRDYHHELPLARHESKAGWVFKASALRLKAEVRENQMQTSRINLAEAAEHRKSGWLNSRPNQANIAGGPFKTSLYYVPTALGELTAYCVGDKSQIERLLTRCKQVGGRRGTGHGRVKSIQVEVVDAGECDWSDRNMPIDSTGLDRTHVMGVSTLNAPYWDRTLHERVLLPTK